MGISDPRTDSLKRFFFFFNIRRLCFIVAIVGVHFHWTCSGVTSPADSLLLLLFVDLWGWPVWLVGFDLPLFWLVFLQQLGMLCIYSWGGGLLLFFLVSLWGKFTAAIDFLRLCCVWNLFLQPPPWEISCGQLSLTQKNPQSVPLWIHVEFNDAKVMKRKKSCITFKMLKLNLSSVFWHS